MIVVSFTKKILSATLSLANGNFGDSGGNTVTLDKLRMSAAIDVVGDGAGKMSLDIYGLGIDVMNKMSTVGTQLGQQNKNSVQLFAGDADDDLNLLNPTLVFSGSIHAALVDAQNQPQVCFRIEAVSGGGYESVKPAPHTSLPGWQSVASIMQSLADLMGLGFDNTAGVNVRLKNPYSYGSAWSQVKEFAQHANISAFVDRGVLVIAPPGKSRSGDPILISPQTGLVSYPSFREAYVTVRCLFDPAYRVSGQVKIQSDLTPACGTWNVFHMMHSIECRTPHGNWFSILECNQVTDETPP